MMLQLAFNLPNKPALGRKNFIISNSNRDAVTWIDSWPNWPVACNGLNVFGPKSSGKSHLGAVWQSRSKAVSLNNPIVDIMKVPEILRNKKNVIIDGFDESWPGVPILHLYNLIKEREGFLIIISSKPVAQLGVLPADLSSRLSTLPVVEIKQPDDELIKQVMQKLFEDRQVIVPSEVLDYLVIRMERSFEEAFKLVARLDAVALSENNSITVALASRVLRNVLETKLIQRRQMGS